MDRLRNKSKSRTGGKKKGGKGMGGALRFDQGDAAPLLADDGYTPTMRKLAAGASRQPQSKGQFQAPDLYVGAADSHGGSFSPSVVRQGLILFYDRHDPARDGLDDVLELLLNYASRRGVTALNVKLKSKYGEDLDDVEVIDLDELFPEDADSFADDMPPPSPEDARDSEAEDPPPLPDFSDRTLRRLKKMSTDRHSVDTRSMRASSDGLPPPPPLPPPLAEHHDAPPPPPLPADEDDGKASGKSKSKRKSFFKSARKSIFGASSGVK